MIGPGSDNKKIIKIIQKKSTESGPEARKKERKKLAGGPLVGKNKRVDH